MMASQFVIDVNEMTFEYEVVAFSKNKPVLVDFWAEWCRPCKMLSPILEKVVNEANGALRLAKVNIDQNPNLAMQFGVRSIPTVKVFIDGRVANEFVGVLPEGQIRAFVDKLQPPSPLELEISRANSMLLSQDWENAENALRDILNQDVESPEAMAGLAKSLLAQDKAPEAMGLLNEITTARILTTVEILKPYGRTLIDFHTETLPNENDLDAIFYNSIRLASQAKYPMALDGLLDILRQEKHYRGKTAQNVILAILEIMGEEDPDTRAYRAELASVLF
jgi:putative thioredoxin